MATRMTTPATASLFSRNTSRPRRNALRGLVAGRIPAATAASPSSAGAMVATSTVSEINSSCGSDGSGRSGGTFRMLMSSHVPHPRVKHRVGNVREQGSDDRREGDDHGDTQQGRVVLLLRLLVEQQAHPRVVEDRLDDQRAGQDKIGR